MSNDHPAQRLTQEESNNLKRAADYSSVQSLPEIWPLAAQRFENIIALNDPHGKYVGKNKRNTWVPEL